MKKLALCGLLLTACAFAQVSYDDLKTQIHTGSSPEAIKEAIRLEGINFDIDIELLRTMKSDRMPDWLIDFLIDYDQRSYFSRAEAPRRGATTSLYDYDPYYSSAFHWGLSPWSCVNWYYYFCDPWGFHRYYGPAYFYGFYGFAPWFSYYPYRYGYTSPYYRRGTVSPRGYRLNERHIVGRAVPRGSSATASRSSATSTRAQSTASRSAVRSTQRGTRISKPTKYRTTSRSRASSSSRSGSSSRATSSSRSRSSSRATARRSSGSSSRSTASRSRGRKN